MKAYSRDLRLRVLAACDRGMPRREAAETFGVSASTIKRYPKLREESGDVRPTPIPGPPARKRAALEERLPTQVALKPDLTPSPSTASFSRKNAVSGFPLPP